MATDYSVHVYGGVAPSLPALAGQVALADTTNSDDIAVEDHAVLIVVPAAKCRFELTDSGDTPDPANSPIVLPADLPSYFHLTAGTWKFQVSAYA